MRPDLLRNLASSLRQGTAELERAFDTLSVGVAIAVDSECRELRFNAVFAEALGIAPNRTLRPGDSAQPRPFVILRGGSPVNRDDLPLQRATRTGVPGSDEIEVVTDGGRRTCLDVHAVPVLDADGRPCGGIAVAVDVTDRRRIEHEQRFLAEASRILSASLECELRLVDLAQLSVPILGDYCAIDVLGDDGAFRRVTLVAADPAKRDVAEALRRFPPSLLVDSPAAAAIRSGEPVVVNACPADVVSRAAQSGQHLALLRQFDARTFVMAPLRARGRTLGLLTVGRFDERRTYDEHDVALAADLSVRAALALDNALLYRNAQEANRIKEDFLATLSHELRTPLNALLGWTQMLKAPSLDEATRRRALESVERNAQAQAVLINDLLDVSRVMSGKLRLDPKPVDLQGIVLAAVDAVRPAVLTRELDLGVSLAPISGEVLGDPDRLQQVVWNLLANAVKFTPPRGRVDVSVEQVGGAVQLVVSDSGAGIDPAFLPHIFERFRQADSSTTRSHGGLGLGLAIVRHLVDLHGGTVVGESEGPGRGSRFVVTLPLRQVGSMDSAGRAAPGADVLLRGVRVLAVDDDADSRELVLLTLRAAGAEVMVVSAAGSALDVFEDFDPHVLVADIALPGMDGCELVRAIRARRLAACPAIALSAYADPAHVREAIDAGFALHLSKPADYARLVQAIAELPRSGAGENVSRG
jgi:signal transduction histidine kinase/ActR/RegA family two-component response regulator